MSYKGYQARVDLDEEAGLFHGEVINTRDVITFQGSSVEELKRAFEDSVDDYLDFPCGDSSRRQASELRGNHDLQGLSSKSRSGDRKSTRLNSSHLVISYAVFCL